MGERRVERVRDAGRTAASRSADLGRTAATKSADLGRTAATKGAELRRNVARLDVPWARCRPARLVREGFLDFILGPMIDFYTRTRASGGDRFKTLEFPVVFVANHSSHLDTPTILRALPRKWRQRTAVAAAADYFYKKRLVANAVALIFNTVPLQRKGGGLGKGSTDHVDKLIDQRWNLLMFPEGTRSRDGRIGKLRSGAAVIATEHNIPIVPILVRGTHEAMPPGRNWPKRIKGRFFSRRHKVEVKFGDPIRPREGEHGSDVMARVRAFYEAQAQGPDGSRFARASREASKAKRPPLSPAA